MGAPRAARWARILVRAAGAGPHRRERELRRPSQPAEAGLGLEPVPRARQPSTRTARIPRQPEGAGAGGREPGPGDREVLLAGGAGAEARCESGGRLRRLPEHRHPAGAPVQPVDQPRLAPEVRRGEEEQARGPARRGLRGEPWRLVHREHLPVLVEDSQRPGGGAGLDGGASALLEDDQHRRVGRHGERGVALAAASHVDRAPADQRPRLVQRAAELPGHAVRELPGHPRPEGPALHAARAPPGALTRESTSCQRAGP